MPAGLSCGSAMSLSWPGCSLRFPLRTVGEGVGLGESVAGSWTAGVIAGLPAGGVGVGAVVVCVGGGVTMAEGGVVGTTGVVAGAGKLLAARAVVSLGSVAAGAGLSCGTAAGTRCPGEIGGVGVFLAALRLISRSLSVRIACCWRHCSAFAAAARSRPASDVLAPSLEASPGVEASGTTGLGVADGAGVTGAAAPFSRFRVSSRSSRTLS